MAYELLRGGERIAVEPIPGQFLAVPSHKQAMASLGAVPGVGSVERLAPSSCLIKLEAEDYDKATLERLRSETVRLQPAYCSVQQPAQRYDVTNRILLAFRPGTPVSLIEETLAKYRLHILHWQADQGLLITEVKEDRDVLEVSCHLQEVPEVEYAEPNIFQYFESFSKPYFPTDPLFAHQWHLHAAERSLQLVPEAGIYAPDAWALTRGSRDIVVAIVDDGFDLQHPDLNMVGKIVHPLDYADNDGHPQATETTPHGTSCAGVAIAEENGQGTVGVAPGCSFMPVRMAMVLDDATLYRMFSVVGKKAHVASCSWGPQPLSYVPLTTPFSKLLHDLEENGGPEGKGCFVCFAAGNSNLPLEGDSFSYRRDQKVQVVNRKILNGYANHPSVVAVAATTSLGRRAAYSNWGAGIDLCAPSSNGDPYDANGYAPGLSIWTADCEPGGYAVSSHFTGDFGGTSSAAPVVAGVAALVFSAHPQLTAREVKEIMKTTADRVEDPEPDACGAHRGQYNSQGHSEWFGYGKVNAAKAVAKAHSLAASSA